MYEIYCQIRDKLGLKDSDVAKGTGITKSTFSDWKSGRSNPKNDKLQKIASFLGISVDYLTTGIEQEGGETYYLNDETKEIAQEIFKNKELRMLFDVSRNASPERLMAYYNLIKAMQDTEKGSD